MDGELNVGEGNVMENLQFGLTVVPFRHLCEGASHEVLQLGVSVVRAGLVSIDGYMPFAEVTADLLPFQHMP